MPASLRNRPILAMLLMLAAACAPLSASPPNGYDFRPLTEALRQAADEGKPMLLYYGRYGCTTCRRMDAEVFSDAGLRQRYNRDFALAYVDTESADRITLPSGERTTEMQFAVASRILGTPTFVFFSPAQEPLFKVAGFKSVELLQRYGDYVTGGHYQSLTLDSFIAEP